jgi:hypothetical protein
MRLHSTVTLTVPSLSPFAFLRRVIITEVVVAEDEGEEVEEEEAEQLQIILLHFALVPVGKRHDQSTPLFNRACLVGPRCVDTLQSASPVHLDRVITLTQPRLQYALPTTGLYIRNPDCILELQPRPSLVLLPAVVHPIHGRVAARILIVRFTDDRINSTVRPLADYARCTLKSPPQRHRIVVDKHKWLPSSWTTLVEHCSEVTKLACSESVLRWRNWVHEYYTNWTLL